MVLTECPLFDLIQLHLPPGTPLRQRYLITGPREGVVSEGDVVLGVTEGHDPLRVRLGHREEVLQDVLDPLTQGRGEVVEDEVGVHFLHGPYIGYVVSHHHVGEGEVGSGSVGEVGDDHGVRHPSVLVQDYQVRDVIALAGLHQVLHHEVAPVDPLTVGQDEPDLLSELLEAG